MNISSDAVKYALGALALLVFLVGVGVGYRLAAGPEAVPMPSVSPTSSPDGIACTMEAKQCPDGSYVGRTGPRCEFAPCPSTRRVELYYYDARRDEDASGILLCSAQGLVPVARDIPNTKTPIGDTIRLLLKGELTAQEQAAGISTEYPLPGFSLKAASLRDGVLTLTFDDLGGKTVGGSCRVGILWAQIEKTALQFQEVSSVRHMPEELFQP